MTDPHASHGDLAARRRDAHQLIEHLQFLQEQFVDQSLVKDALLRGLSQSDTAKLLSMSKKTVNRLAHTPFVRYAAARDPRVDDRLAFDGPFFEYVWGSAATAREAKERCQQYDRERLHIESD